MGLAAAKEMPKDKMAGVEVLCDGGTSFGKLFHKKRKHQKAKKTAVEAA